MNEYMVCRCEIPQSVALAAGVNKFGRFTVRPTEEEFAALTEDQRRVLSKYLVAASKVEKISEWYQNVVVLDTVSGTWSDVMRVIDAMIAKEAANAAKEREIMERATEAALASPIEGWVRDSYRESRAEIPYDYRFASTSDPRIVAKLAQARQIAEARNAEAAALAEQTRIRDEAASAAREAAQQAYRELCRQYVIEHVSEYQRAARDGRDVTRPAERHACSVIESALEGVGALVQPYATVREASTPDDNAYAAMDEVQLALAIPPQIVRSAATRLVRVDTCPASTCKAGHRTCVEVICTWGDETTTTHYVYADSKGPHDHDDSESDEE